MVIASTCGDLSLEVVRRHMRRILGQRGIGMKQDALRLKNDSNKVNSIPYMASSNDNASDYPLVGEIQVTFKKKKKRKRALPHTPPVNHPKNGATPNRINPRTGHRNRRYGSGSESQLLPQCPGQTPNAARRVPIAMDHPEGGDPDAAGGEVYTTSVSPGLLVGHSASDSAVIIDTGAPADRVGARWPNNRNAKLRSLRRPPAKLTPAPASCRYGDGRVGDVPKAKSIPIATLGCTGHFLAYVVDADIPAPLAKEALEALGGNLNFCQRVLTLGKLGTDIPLKMNALGR